MDLDARARDAAAGLRRTVDQFDAVELGARPRSHRRLPVLLGLAATIALVAVVAFFSMTRTNEAHEPAGSKHSMWGKVSMRRAFGSEAVMRDVVGTRWGFVATGSEPRRCPGPPACPTRQHLWFSPGGRRWTEVSYPGLQTAQSDVRLGRAGERVLAVWSSPRGLAAAWSSNGRDWHRSTVRQPAAVSERAASQFPSWDVGDWSRGVVASELADGIESWVSRDGSVWTHAEVFISPGPEQFLFPQGVRIGATWIGITGGRRGLLKRCLSGDSADHGVGIGSWMATD